MIKRVRIQFKSTNTGFSNERQDGEIMKRLFLLATIMLSGLTLLGQGAELVQAGSIDYIIPTSNNRAPELFNSQPGVDPPAFAVVSSSFTDAVLGGFMAAGADDFTVPSCGWQITEVTAFGNYSDPAMTGSSGPATSVNIYILGDAGGLPDTTNLSAGAIYAAEGLSYTELDAVNGGDFEIQLPGGGVFLTAGTYWLVVQANIELLAVGQWNWTESSLTPNSGTTNGNESAWFQISAGVASPITGNAECVGAWNARVTSCQMTRSPDTNPPADRDFAFRLGGTDYTTGQGVTIAPTALFTTEDGSAVQYSVVLDTPPSAGATVTVTPASGDVTEGTVSGALMFTIANWDIPQMVTVTPGASGDGNDGDVMYSITHGVSTTGTCYSGVTAGNVDVTNANIEGVATIIVDPASGLVVSEDGVTTAIFTVSAVGTPTADVTVDLTNNSPTEVTLSSASAVMTAGNGYSVDITVTGVADDVVENPMPFSVTTEAAVSGDLAYAGVNPPDVAGTVTDSNTAAITVTPNQTPLQTTEVGGTDTIDYVLTAQPTADVTFTLNSDDPAEGSVAPASLTFTNANWDTPQTVTVTGVDDDIDDGLTDYNIIATPTTSTDPFWVGVQAVSVAAQNADDGDTAGVSADDLGGVETAELGNTTDTFTVVLDSEPVFDTTITVTSSDTSEGLLSSTGGAPFTTSVDLFFSAATWDVPQTVTVQGQTDGIVDGDITYPVNLTVASGDPLYDGIAAPSVSVTNLNEDLCGPMSLEVSVGSSIIACGSEGCVFDLYDSCEDPLLFLGTFTIPAGGCVDTGIIAEPDACYIATATGFPTVILAGPATTVPTLGEWGLIALITLFAGAGLVFLRRRA